MKQLLFFSLIFISACVGPVFIYVALAFFYSLHYEAYELVILSAMIDVLFGPAGFAIPYFTLTTIFWLLIITVLKPRFAAYK